MRLHISIAMLLAVIFSFAAYASPVQAAGCYVYNYVWDIDGCNKATVHNPCTCSDAICHWYEDPGCPGCWQRICFCCSAYRHVEKVCEYRESGFINLPCGATATYWDTLRASGPGPMGGPNAAICEITNCANCAATTYFDDIVDDFEDGLPVQYIKHKWKCNCTEPFGCERVP